MNRFNILVLNYKRLHSFLDNFGKIKNFDPLQDRITILTSSPSAEERQQVKRFSEKYQVQVEYLTRRNYGMAEGARVEYFSGKIENLAEVLNNEYIFQFQDHYLDINAPYSNWGEKENFRVKGDVVPDNIIFDLNLLSHILRENEIVAAFCDRNNPCWFQRDGFTYIAPNGGNYILNASQIANNYVQRELRRIYDNCDSNYFWAVYVEFKWGELFFHEGKNYYDIKRDKIYAKFPVEEFYIAPDPIHELYSMYEKNLVSRIRDKCKSGIMRLLRNK